jgi:restriction system protein
VPIPADLLEALFFPTGLGLVALWLLTRRRQQQVLVRKAADARTLEDLLALSPSEFEAMVAHLYNQSGHQARRTGQTGDQGIDLVVQAKNGEKWVVQCKRWRGSVGAPVIRDFYGAMQHEKADKGTVITTGKFTRQAREWAAGKPITLYDGEKLIEVWRQAQGAS